MCMPKSGKGTNFLFCNYSAWIFLYIIWLCFHLIICPIKNKIDMMCYLFALQIKLCLTLSICIPQILQYWGPLMPPVLCKGFWLFHCKWTNSEFCSHLLKKSLTENSIICALLTLIFLKVTKKKFHYEYFHEVYRAAIVRNAIGELLLIFLNITIFKHLRLYKRIIQGCS